MKKTAIVVIITVMTMAAEITFGLITGSMALLADGIHMGTHTFALLVTLLAYLLAGKHRRNPDFAFSSGKLGVLGGYTNAILLGITALYMVYEAIHRLIKPEQISFNQALLVAVLGLAVNLVCAVILSDGGGNHHGHSHADHDHATHDHHDQTQTGGGHTDHNLRSAYIHVITDALTSVLAIAALLTGKLFGATWPDAAVAILGAVVILKWAYGLLISSGAILVDFYPSAALRQRLQTLAQESGAHISDFHIWQTSENDTAVILHLEAPENFDLDAFKCLARAQFDCNHLTVELTETGSVCS